MASSVKKETLTRAHARLFAKAAVSRGLKIDCRNNMMEKYICEISFISLFIIVLLQVCFA